MVKNKDFPGWIMWIVNGINQGSCCRFFKWILRIDNAIKQEGCCRISMVNVNNF